MLVLVVFGALVHHLGNHLHHLILCDLDLKWGVLSFNTRLDEQCNGSINGMVPMMTLIVDFFVQLSQQCELALQ